MRLKVDVKETDAEITKKILNACKFDLRVAMNGSRAAIKKRIGNICDDLISGSNEYQSLIGGELLGELGVPDVDARLKRILSTIRDSIEVVVMPVQIVNNQLEGGLSIGILRSDFQDILDLPESSYISSGKYMIPWLQWLIVDGDQILIFTHQITYDLSPEEKARSRSGMALMIEGSGWSVPPWASGIPEDNFLTRAFNFPKVADTIAQIIEEEVTRRIKGRL